MQSNNLALTTISQLRSLVEIDRTDDKLSGVAELFLKAADDWPTFNQIEISKFVGELKEYFGIPLTKDGIVNKTLEGLDGNAWRHEAASSISEMLVLSEKLHNLGNFDKILENIISYYQLQLNNVDFVADLKYLTTEEGGRKTPALSGYRPQVKFPFSEMQTSGQQTFLNKGSVYPGDEVKAAIKILSTNFFEGSLTEGMSFEFREGARIIGTGKITDILNQQLKKTSN